MKQRKKALDNKYEALSGPTKKLILIRHGESQGQAAKSNGLNRKRDASLRDADLTGKGIKQAKNIRDHMPIEEVDLVIVSPLTRALRTALLGFASADVPFVVHYDIREMGSAIPENLPRPTDDVKKTLADCPGLDGVDFESFRSPSWPEVEVSAPKSDRLREFLKFVGARSESTIAVVCHFNVIDMLLRPTGSQIKPVNALPIHCVIDSKGNLRLE